MACARTKYWFALNIFRDFPKVLEDFSAAGLDTYRAVKVEEEYGRSGLIYREVPLIPHLLFVRCPVSYLEKYKLENNGRLMYYRDLATGKPGPVNEREMEIFRIVTSVRGADVRVLGEDKPEYHKGDKVRVIAGLYKGAEGYIKRVQRSRDLIVCVQGVAVLAVSHIHPQFLEKIDDDEISKF